MVANDSVVGIGPSAHIEHIDSDPFEEPGAGVVAIPGFAYRPQDKVCHAVANIHDPAFPWQFDTHVLLLLLPTIAESLGRFSRLDSSLRLTH
jgi:hypothetical protein